MSKENNLTRVIEETVDNIKQEAKLVYGIVLSYQDIATYCLISKNYIRRPSRYGDVLKTEVIHRLNKLDIDKISKMKIQSLPLIKHESKKIKI